MDMAPSFAALLRRTLLALLICAVLVVLCYFFVDRPVAFFVYHADFKRFEVLKELTFPPPVLQDLAPAVLTVLMVRRVWGPFRRWEKALLAAGVAVILADQFRESLGVVFGRYWPKTWIDNNPSLIQDNAYGFHLFHRGPWYGSFPSGHTARMAGAGAVYWIAYPRWRWLAVAAPLAVALGLLGMDYHFVSDVIGGAFVGAIVGVYTARFCDLTAAMPSGGGPGPRSPGQ